MSRDLTLERCVVRGTHGTGGARDRSTPSPPAARNLHYGRIVLEKGDSPCASRPGASRRGSSPCAGGRGEGRRALVR